MKTILPLMMLILLTLTFSGCKECPPPKIPEPVKIYIKQKPPKQKVLSEVEVFRMRGTKLDNNSYRIDNYNLRRGEDVSKLLRDQNSVYRNQAIDMNKLRGKI